MNPRVKEVKILENYQLLLTFYNGEKNFWMQKHYLNTNFTKELEI